MSDEQPLPELYQGTLDSVTLAQLFRDLAAAEVLEIAVRMTGAERGAAPLQVSLDRARLLLTTGQASGVRLRYRFDGSEWLDTLLRTSDDVKLVRMQCPPAEC